MTEVVSRLGQEAVSPPAQPTAAVAGGLVQMILEAARAARRDKSRCQQLAREVLMVGYLLVKLRSLGVMQDPRVAIALEGLDDTLQQAYELVVSCQYPESFANRCFSFALGGRRLRAKQFRRVQEEMGDYLRLDPSVRHADLTLLQEHQLLSCDREAHAPSSFNIFKGLNRIISMYVFLLLLVAC
jgi:interleukin-1 receptor-associated kinase 1